MWKVRSTSNNKVVPVRVSWLPYLASCHKLPSLGVSPQKYLHASLLDRNTGTRIETQAPEITTLAWHTLGQISYAHACMDAPLKEMVYLFCRP